MKDDSIVVTAFSVSDKVLDCLWGNVGKQFDFNCALRGMQNDVDFGVVFAHMGR